MFLITYAFTGKDNKTRFIHDLAPSPIHFILDAQSNDDGEYVLINAFPVTEEQSKELQNYY